jgi:glutamyl-Q tRNA(Asp) synthetase
MGKKTFRFAPSPNGLLHLGHALSALVNRRMAEAAGGRLLLRLEDIDSARCRPEYEAAMIADLAWLGVAFAEPPRRQSEHLEAHRSALEALRRDGLLYPCFCSRGDILRATARHGMPWPADPDGSPRYPGTCRGLSNTERAARIDAGEPHALRLDMAHAVAVIGSPPPWRAVSEDLSAETLHPADPAAWGDVVLARKEIPTSYHLAVVVDDAAQGVTHVVRGADLEAATAVHRVLQRLLGLPEPLYHHHRLLLGPDGAKLSKSTGSTALSALRAQSWTPADVARAVGF